MVARMNLITKISTRKGLVALAITCFASLLSFGIPSISHAAAVVGFNPGNIMDNMVMTNAGSMSVAQIQTFLNSKVPVCDTWHAGFYGSSGTWYGPPFTCLKDYTENSLTAAQIIYNAAHTYSINPQVLLVLLQKEEALITDTWPASYQYKSATGYGCPDSTPGVCSSSYFGFTNQINNAAKLFHSVVTSSPTWYSPYVLGNNNIQWSPNASCGSSTVYIQNLATAALYDYTPYRPNQASLNAGYGTGDSCSSYGNRNFYLYFTDWFGTTINPSLYYAIIQGPNSPALYLQTSAGKYYIPSGELMQAWGIDKLPIQQVTQSYLDSLKTGPWIGKLLKDDWNNYFVVDGGKLHYVRNTSYLSLWNISSDTAVQSLGLVYTIPGGTWVGRFIRDINQPTGQIWLIDGGSKHALTDSNALYEWGYTPDQLTTISTSYLDSIPTSSIASQYVTNGSTKYYIDMGRKLNFTNTNIENAFVGSQSPNSYATNTLSFLPTENALQFVVDISNGRWYMLENGKKHYITQGRIAEIWGKPASQAPTRISSGFIAGLPNGGNLQYIVQTTNPSMSWIIDGTKRYISTPEIANAWTLPNTIIPTYSTQSLNHLNRGSDITNIINGSGSSFSYLMDNGSKRYLSTNNATQGWGQATTTTNSLVTLIPEGSFINHIIKNSSGGAFLMMNSTAYPIDPSFNDAWGVSNSTPSVADETISRYPVGSTLQSFVRIAGISYIMRNGQKIPIKKYADAYTTSTLGEVTLPADYFNTAPEASYLIKSTDKNDSRIWLMTGGKKLLLNTFEQQVSYGYLSRAIQPTALTPSALGLIPNDSQPFSLLIQKPNSGIKFISFGSALGFPNGDTLFSYISASNQIIQVPPSVFDSFTLLKATSRLIRDDYGNYYWMESGYKRHIATLSALLHYRAINPQEAYLEGTTMNLIPLGPSIN